jgi:quinol monooxygenase YgiN
MRQPNKFIVTIELAPGTRDEILIRAPEVQLATRAENGCHEPAYAERLLKDHTQPFLEFYEPSHRSFTFETITAGA